MPEDGGAGGAPGSGPKCRVKDPPPFMLFVETVTKQWTFVDVHESDTIAKVRAEINLKEPEFAIDKNLLFYDGEGPLEDTKTVKEVGIAEAHQQSEATQWLRGKERVKVQYGGKSPAAVVYLEPDDTVRVIKDKIAAGGGPAAANLRLFKADEYRAE
jgi:hypothetical protein